MPSPEAFVSVHKNTVGIGPGLCRILLHGDSSRLAMMTASA